MRADCNRGHFRSITILLTPQHHPTRSKGRPPGLGGHCIPIDPFYLSWKTKQAGIEARFIELAGHMPHFVVEKIQNALNDHGKSVRGSHVLAFRTRGISTTSANLRSLTLCC
jgi:UDP-N-acetyl-D-mannosaminuronate dehydrogenase